MFTEKIEELRSYCHINMPDNSPESPYSWFFPWSTHLGFTLVV